MRFIAGLAAGDLNQFHTSLGRLYLTVGPALWRGFVAWAAYLAVEPVIRRKWPQSLISWNRMLAGRLRDPLLGRDLLLGVLGGCATVFGFGLRC
jgi:serine/threonine-protein kinase